VIPRLRQFVTPTSSGKPVPNRVDHLEDHVTRYSIEDRDRLSTQEEAPQGRATLSNYTAHPQKFRLGSAVLPEPRGRRRGRPKPTVAEGKIVSWDLKSINSSEQLGRIV